MADDTPTPMTQGDATPPPATTEFEPAAPLKDAGVEFEPADASGDQSRTEQATRTIKDNAGKYGAQVADKARALADTGKERATGALGNLSTLLDDAATQVDEKLGAQYGDYARTAAGSVKSFADQLQAKNVDDLVDDARAFVGKSPAIAVGIAAALGFVVARVVQSGLDADRA